MNAGKDSSEEEEDVDAALKEPGGSSGLRLRGMWLRGPTPAGTRNFHL